MTRLLRVKTTQARASTWVLSGLPVLLWLALVALDVAALPFYATPLGALTGVGAGALILCARWWSARLVDAAAAAADAADPLVPARPRPDPWAICALALPTLLIVGVSTGAALALPAAAVAAAVGWRRSVRRATDAETGATGPRGGTADAVELLAIALEAGLALVAAVEVVARLAPQAARPPLAAAARRLQAGTPVGVAFAGDGLAQLGAVLAVTQRWGAPAGPALRNLATELRLERRAAAEQAAERVELALIFPTTLLTLPAFVLAVVPPLLWTTFTNRGG